MKKDIKKVFINRYKFKAMIKYKKVFFEKIKLLLSYFVKFSKCKIYLFKYM